MLRVFVQEILMTSQLRPLIFCLAQSLKHRSGEHRQTNCDVHQLTTKSGLNNLVQVIFNLFNERINFFFSRFR
jgi:hypothetical protein